MFLLHSVCMGKVGQGCKFLHLNLCRNNSLRMVDAKNRRNLTHFLPTQGRGWKADPRSLDRPIEDWPQPCSHMAFTPYHNPGRTLPLVPCSLARLKVLLPSLSLQNRGPPLEVRGLALPGILIATLTSQCQLVVSSLPVTQADIASFLFPCP